MATYNAIPRTTEANHGKAQGVSNATILKHWRNKYLGGTYGSGIKRN